MNGPSTVSHSAATNEQLVGKFHVEKVPNNLIGNHDDVATVPVQSAPLAPSHPTATAGTDEAASGSRFQMIRVDRNFSRGRWKVNDFEPPENTLTSTNPPVNNMDNDSVHSTNPLNYTSLPAVVTTANTAPTASILTQTPNLQQTVLSADSNANSAAATLTATAASVAAAAATAFQQQQQQQQQQRLGMANPPPVMPTANVPNPASLLHAFPPTGLPNMPAPNQGPYILANHPQYGYYPYYPSPYHHYPQWANLPPHNAYFPPPPLPSAAPLPPGNLGDPSRHPDGGVSDVTNDSAVIPSNPFPNSAPDHLQNAQIAAAAAAAAAPFIYAAHHPPYLPQATPATTASPYATIAAYHTPAPQPTIIPPNQPLSHAQTLPSNPTELPLTLSQMTSHSVPSATTSMLTQPVQQAQQQAPQTQQTAPMMTSPKHDAAKNPGQQQSAPNTMTKATPTATAKHQINPNTVPTNGTQPAVVNPAAPSHPVTDLLSSSPSTIQSQSSQASLLSPITVQTTHSTPGVSANPHGLNKASTNPLNEIWPYSAANSALNIAQTAAQTAAVTAAAAMGLLNNETSKNAEITTEILKELTTPTKQNNFSERRARLRYRRQRSTPDIDQKISAAMDLVKQHLLSAVREEVTELRQQIRTLNDKVAIVEHENAFLRQQVSSDVLAQYIPLYVGLNPNMSNESNNTTTATATITSVPNLSSSSVASSQTLPMVSQSSIPSSMPVPTTTGTSSNTAAAAPPQSVNLPPIN